MDSRLSFMGQVAIVTGAGGSLGRSHCLALASRGCKVVAEDIDAQSVDDTVSQCKALGVDASACILPVLEAEGIVDHAMKKFGRVDILINNAGVLRDAAFKNVTKENWDLIFDVHVRGAYALTSAVWQQMRSQKFGRIIMTSSAAALYGNVGQSSYSAAKAALIGFSNTLSREGEAHGIYVNAICPLGASRMTERVLPQEALKALDPRLISAMVCYLCSKESKVNGKVFEFGGGWFSQIRWQRSRGKAIAPGDVSAEAVRDSWEEITSFDEGFDFPTAPPFDLMVKNGSRPGPRAKL